MIICVTPHPQGCIGRGEAGAGGVRRRGWLGWVGLGCGLHRRQAPTASVSFPHRLDWALPRLSGLTAPQTADDPQNPAKALVGGRCRRACLSACAGSGGLGGGFKAGAHLLSLSSGPGVVCARCSGPQQRGMGALPGGC